MEYQVDSNGVATLFFSMSDSSVNVLNKNSISEFSECVKTFINDESAKSLIITSKTEPFCAGADLKELLPLHDTEKNMKMVKNLSEAFRLLEKSSKPVVALISGTVLGGGYELCLACNYRIAVNNKKIKIGLPEVQLGLLPGAGGTQRLPRMIGIQPAALILTEGKKLSPEQAKEKGLVEELADNLDSAFERAKEWIQKNSEAYQPWDQKGFKIPGGAVMSPKNYQVFVGGVALTAQKTLNNYPAPRAILSCLYEGLQLDFDSALKVEARYFEYLLKTTEAKSLIQTLFFGVNQLSGGAKRPQSPSKAEIKKVAILGAGMMGGGIAYASAKAGYETIVKDISEESAKKAKDYSEKILSKELKRNRTSEAKIKEHLDLIHTTTKASDLENVDLIIEAVPESRKIKKQAIEEAQEQMAKGALVSSNTSTLPITSLAEYSKNPERFIGLHFFSPVEKMPLVEIIKGEKTDETAVAHAIDFALSIKKTPIVVNDGRGFFTSRIFTTYVNEGMALLKEGIAPALIDNAGKMAGMPVGPLAVADEVSIDLVYHVLKQTEEDLGEKLETPAMEVSDLFVNQLKRLGRKSGGGFYEYSKEGKKKLWPELSKYYPLAKEQPSVEIIQRRLLNAQALEAARAFEEGIVEDALSGDVGSIFGLGFPAFTGGVFSYIDNKGIKEFNKECKELEEKYGKTFKVPEILIKKEKEGESFHG